jgi:NADPH:quinone reductase-like Zn-dependent oxidoreductase
VLIQVAAAAINNTDVNTRIGWYSKAITSGTGEGGAAGFDAVDEVDATWSGTALEFPRIQGADVCGRIVDVGEGVSRDRIGERVLVRSMLRTTVAHRPFECWTFGSECDGGFRRSRWLPLARRMPFAVTGATIRRMPLERRRGSHRARRPGRGLAVA